ncbi:hypothetical protein PAERUG_E15_London_28_01_14_07916 [Pseudomonas aeruginosa]|nr:hypothetical protein PAERUG_E15_London_28_01_14_07916 [Pseudomonas aeruginosa]
MTESASKPSTSSSGQARRKADSLLIVMAVVFSFSTLFDLPAWVLWVQAVILLIAILAVTYRWVADIHGRAKKGA